MKISSLMIKLSSYGINLHFLLTIEFFAFSNRKLNNVSLVAMFGITILIFAVSVAALAIHLKIKKKEIENDESE